MAIKPINCMSVTLSKITKRKIVFSIKMLASNENNGFG